MYIYMCVCMSRYFSHYIYINKNTYIYVCVCLFQCFTLCMLGVLRFTYMFEQRMQINADEHGHVCSTSIYIYIYDMFSACVIHCITYVNVIYIYILIIFIYIFSYTIYILPYIYIYTLSYRYIYIYISFFITERSLEVKLPTIWTDEKQRWEESEKVREEKRRESPRSKKIQAREKVGKSRNTVFFQ